MKNLMFKTQVKQSRKNIVYFQKITDSWKISVDLINDKGYGGN